MKKLLTWVLTLIFTVSLCGCAMEENKESDKVQVYTSFYAMYDFAKQICGDKADIYVLCPTGQEPHDYEPTPKDIAKLSSADIFVYNSMGMEHWVDSVLETLKDTDVICVNTTYNAPFIIDNNDPHVWLNPKNAFSQMAAIYDAIISVDPNNLEYYNDNLENCRNRIGNLINDYNTAVAGFKTKDIVVSHAAYGNLCHAFGLNQVPVNGIDNSGDPSPSQMAKTEKFIKDNGITHIFKEPLGTSTVIDTIRKYTNTQVLILDPFEGSPEGKDYFTVMYENLQALKTALS